MNINLQEPHSTVDFDIANMHKHYGVDKAVEKLDNEKLKAMLTFRFNFLREELEEGYIAIADENPEEIVDSLIDLVVVAVGTLDLYGVDFHKAWHQVLDANMNKEVGIKPSRPNPLGLPDPIKPEGWTGPDHTDNHGTLPKCFEK